MFPWAHEEVACSAYTAARLLAQVNYLQNKSVGTKGEKPQSKVRSKETVSIGKEQGQRGCHWLTESGLSGVVGRRLVSFCFVFPNSIYIRDPIMGRSLLYWNWMVPITETEKNRREKCKVRAGPRCGSPNPAQPRPDSVASGAYTLYDSVSPSAKWKWDKHCLPHGAMISNELTRVKCNGSLGLYSKCRRYINSSYYSMSFWIIKYIFHGQGSGETNKTEKQKNSPQVQNSERWQ